MPGTGAAARTLAARHRQASSSRTAASAATPASQSARLRVLGRRVRHAGRVAHEQHRRRQPGGEHAGVVTRSGRQHRRRDPAAGQRRRPPGRAAQRSNSTAGVNDSRRLADRHAVAGAARSAAAVDLADQLRRASASSRRPGVEPGVHRRADRVGRARARRATLPKVASAPSSAAAVLAASTVAAYGSIGSRRSASRVVPAWSARPVKSNRHRPCGQIDSATPTARVRARPARCPARCAARRTRRSGRAARRPARSRSGSRPAPVIASASVTPSPSRSSARPSGVDGAGQQPAAQAGHAEPGALLLGEGGDRRPAARAPARAREQVDRRERGDDAERPVERAAVRHRVQVSCR